MNQNLLTHAQLAFERNDLYEASQLFRLLVTHYPDISAGWLGLFQASDDHAERIECLEQLLRITHAENQAAMTLSAQTPDDEIFESIDGGPGSEFELIQSHEEPVPLEIIASMNTSGTLPEILPARRVTSRPTQKMQPANLVEELAGTVNRLTNMAEAGLQPVVQFIKDTVRTNSIFTTQFSTSYGRKMRRVPSARMQMLPNVLNRVWR